MKSGIFLSVREKATRFPGKVLKPLGGQTLTAFLIGRLKTTANADFVVLTTSTDPRDGVLCDIAEAEGVLSFRGSPDDKLLRYRDAARAFGLDYAVIVDGDDPFVSIEHIDRIIAHNMDHSIDFTTCGDLPLGATGFGLSRGALELICDERPEQDTEVWGSLFLDDPRFTCATLHEPDEGYRRPDIRMTLDYPEDYEFFLMVSDALAAAGRPVDFSAIMTFLKENPGVVKINQGVQEKYERHLNQSATNSSVG